MTLHGADGRLRYGWDGEVETPFLGLVDDVPVAVGTVATTEYDNLHLAWLGFKVHPEHRRRGLGSEMLEALVAETQVARPHLDRRRRLGRRGAAAFAARHGLEEKSRAVNRRQHLAEVDWAELERLHDEALAAASAYELVRRGRSHSRRRARGGGRDVRRDQRRTDRRPRHRGRGVLARADPRLRGRPARAGRRALPGPGPAPRDRRAGRPHRWSWSRASGRSSATSTTPRSSASHRGHRLGAAAQDRHEPAGCARCSPSWPRSTPGTPSRTTT